MTIMEQVKALLGISDDLQDNQLQVIQDITEAHFRAYTNQYDVPEELHYIIVEVMVKRFNRLGSEGMTSQKVEGLDMTFAFDDFEEYDRILKQYFADYFQAGFKML